MARNQAQRAAVALAEPSARRRWGAALAGRLPHSPRALTLAALALALAIRVWLVAASHGMMDGDEAALGIQAENILRGQFPVYFPGQNYMGSWDAYLMAPLVYFFGPTALAPRIVTLAEYLLYLPLVGMVAARLYGERARAVALLFTALPPLYITVTELRMLGGYIETLTIGAALLLLTLEIRQRWRDGRASFWQWALVGGLIGLGLWIDTLTVEYVIACALWLAPAALRRLRTARVARGGWLAVARAALPAVVAALVVGAICAAPMLLSPQTYAGGNPALPGRLFAGAHTASPSGLGVAPLTGNPVAARGYVLLYFVYRTVPQVIGAAFTFPPLSAWTILALVIGVLAAAVMIMMFVIISRATRWSLVHPVNSVVRSQDGEPWNAALPIILGAVTLGAYLGLKLLSPPYWLNDQSRYILPLTTACTLALAYALTWLSRRPAILLARASRRRGQRTVRGATVAGALLALLLLLYGLPYGLSDPILAFNSPYNEFDIHQRRIIPADAFPAQDIALLDYLKANHIQTVWVNHWIGNVVMYLSSQRIQCADYVDVVHQRGINRFPAAYHAVASAARPSYVIAWDGVGPPPLASALDALGVRYQSAQFGRYWVITPLSRTVSPAEVIPALIQTYW